jgi:signal transduction histidine kinase
MRWPLPFYSARPGRAISEALLVGVILWGTLLVLQNQVSPFLLQVGLSLLIGLCCALVCALRLQLSQGFQQGRSTFEVTIATLLSLGLSGMELACIFVLLHGSTVSAPWREGTRPWQLAAIALAADWSVFIIARVTIRLWRRWSQLRSKHLLWALTHAHATGLVLAAGLLIVVLETLVVYRTSDSFLIVSSSLGLLILGIVALVLIVPPSALVSYTVVRRTTERLQTLAAGTSALRNGNYAMRIPVVGEDEVAQLQSDFNAMAAELERARRELQEERDRVASLLQARRELIANVSHELRTPVTTLRGYLETTLEHWNRGSQATSQQDLQVMEHEVIHLQALVEDLFTLARADVGRLTLQCQPTDVGALVRGIVEAAAPLAWRASKIEVVADTPGELPAALVDPGRMEQVLQNLIHNAVRHTSPGGIVAVMVKAEPQAVILQVKDTGEGIAPEELPHIWERFYQTESARTRMHGGTGLGLALVKEWIEAMGGTVAVTSVLGNGSCFSLRLPTA